MTLHDYLLKHLDFTAMIELSVNEAESFQYNYWNWFHNISQLHLLKDDYGIGHIIHAASITEKDDGSIVCESKYFPKKFKMNFYFGGTTP